ncbi:hypothetical protein RABR111495_05410 [Rahnella bruchi]
MILRPFISGHLLPDRFKRNHDFHKIKNDFHFIFKIKKYYF